MKAMLLAAGQGQRMRPLTNKVPKPLLLVQGKPLIVHHIEALVRAGITDLVINTAYLAESLHQQLQDGAAWGARIRYSDETECLETGGGISHALPLLGEEIFLVVNADIFTDFDFSTVSSRVIKSAHLFLTDNPLWHPAGDFSFLGQSYTYSGIALFQPGLFKNRPEKKWPLRQLFDQLLATGELSGEYFSAQWFDVGTPERLAELNRIKHDHLG